MGYNPWGCKESYTTEHSTATFVETVRELTLAHQVTFISLNPVAISPAYFISQCLNFLTCKIVVVIVVSVVQLLGRASL